MAHPPVVRWGLLACVLALSGCADPTDVTVGPAAWLEDPARALSVEEADGAPGWRALSPAEARDISLGHTSSAWWLKWDATLSPARAGAARLLFLGPSSAMTAALHVRPVGGRWERMDAITGRHGHDPRARRQEFLYFEIPPATWGQVTLALRVESLAYAALTPRWLSVEGLAARLATERLVGGAFYGILLAALLVVLVLFWAFRLRVYAWLAVCQAALLLYFLEVHEKLPIPDVGTVLRESGYAIGSYYVGYLLLMTAFATGVQGVRRLMDLGRVSPAWDRVVVRTLQAQAGVMVVSPWMTAYALDSVTNVLGVLALVLVIVSGVLAIRAGRSSGWWQMAAWCALAAGAFTNVLTQTGLVPFTLAGFYAFELGAAVHAVLVLVVLAHLIHASLDQQACQAREMAGVNTALASARARVRALASTLATVQQKERQQIARDLHDHVGQNLAALRMKLGLLRDGVPQPQRDEVLSAHGLVAEIMTDLRHLTFELGPPGLFSQAIGVTLSDLAARVLTPRGITSTCSALGADDDAGEDLKILVYQVARELLANVVKHARARHVEITTMEGDGHLSLMVEDDGQGFASLEVERGATAGFGLLSVVERVEQAGGKVEVESTPGEGTRVTVHVPLPLSGKRGGGEP